MINGKLLRDCFISAAHSITNNRASVDKLNVFPVPDGDTGTNMSMTIQNALPDLLALPDSCTVDTVATMTASALLRGARGNSGVILSLLFRGFGRAMAGKKEANGEDIAFALTKGVEYAYRAVMKPTEGTILTVARLASVAAKENAEKLDAVELWGLVVRVANETLETTPDLLPILKKAGVVDAGGKGYCVIVEAILETLKTGKIIPLADGSEEPAPSPRTGVFATDLAPDLANAYCTEFLIMKNERANGVRLRAFLEAIGDSVVCVDDDEIIKCHVHTATPDKAINQALKHGQLTKIKIENMAEQYAERQAEGERMEHNEGEFKYIKNTNDVDYAFVAVGAGDGVQDLFKNLGASRIVNGGQTMNPSTEDIINAVQSISAKNILVLANNKNIILSAQQAAKLCDRPAHVVPTRSIPEGISALMSFDETVSVEVNLKNMEQAISAVTTGEITFASRDSEFDGQNIKENEILALIGGKLAFTETSPAAAAERLIEQLATDEKSFVTIIYGDATSADEAERLLTKIKKRIPSDIEVSLVNGGMPVYYYCISVE